MRPTSPAWPRPTAAPRSANRQIWSDRPAADNGLVALVACCRGQKGGELPFRFLVAYPDKLGDLPLVGFAAGPVGGALPGDAQDPAPDGFPGRLVQAGK